MPYLNKLRKRGLRGLGTCYRTNQSGQVLNCDNPLVALANFTLCMNPVLDCGDSAADSVDVYARAPLSLATPVPPAPPPGALDPTNPNSILNTADPQALVDSIAQGAFQNTQAAITAQALAQGQADNAAANAVPFCGPGSTQWVQGIDNCWTLGIGAALLVFLGVGVGRR